MKIIFDSPETIVNNFTVFISLKHMKKWRFSEIPQK